MKFMDVGQHCFESQEVVDTDFGLNDDTKNQAFANKELKKKRRVIEETNDYILFQTGDKFNGTFDLIDKDNNRIDYFVRYKSEKYDVLGTFVTQVMLWRRNISPYVQNITTRIFYDELLKQWSTIMSDNQQTRDGYEFWERRLSDAYRKGYAIGIIDLRNRAKTKKIYTGKINKIKEWLKENDVYGPDEKHFHIRYFISRDESIKNTK